VQQADSRKVDDHLGPATQQMQDDRHRRGSRSHQEERIEKREAGHQGAAIRRIVAASANMT
jgi:hypothetical protein